MSHFIKTDSRGNYTVEAAIIFSVIILVLSCLILSLMLMYHKILLTKTAVVVAQKAADMWTEGKNLYDDIWEDSWGEKTYTETVEGAVGLGEKCLQPPFEIRSGRRGVQEEKVKTMQLAVRRELSRIVRRPESTTVVFKYKNYLLSKEITVTIIQEMKIPFGSIKHLFDGKDTVTLLGTGTAAVTQPAEYGRNVDLFLEYAGKLNIKECIKKIQDWIVQ